MGSAVPSEYSRRGGDTKAPKVTHGNSAEGDTGAKLKGPKVHLPRLGQGGGQRGARPGTVGYRGEAQGPATLQVIDSCVDGLLGQGRAR